MKFKNFWIWISLLGGLLTVVDSAHELAEDHKKKKEGQLQIEQKENEGAE